MTCRPPPPSTQTQAHCLTNTNSTDLLTTPGRRRHTVLAHLSGCLERILRHRTNTRLRAFGDSNVTFYGLAQIPACGGTTWTQQQGVQFPKSQSVPY
ncbi:unnamed protein product [Caretta caretta]